jgi:hypothetical protein
MGLCSIETWIGWCVSRAGPVDIQREVYRCGPKVKPFLLITVSDPLELRAVLNRLFKIPEDAGIPAAPVDVPSKRLRIGNLKDKEESASEDSDDDDDE